MYLFPVGGRTMNAVGLFLKSDGSETSPENDDSLFSWHNKHFGSNQSPADVGWLWWRKAAEILSQYSAWKKKQTQRNTNCCFLFSGCLSVISFSSNAVMSVFIISQLGGSVAAVPGFHTCVFAYSEAPCCITAECNTIRHYKLLFTPQTQEQETQVNSMKPSSDYQLTTRTAPLTFHERVQAVMSLKCFSGPTWKLLERFADVMI